MLLVALILTVWFVASFPLGVVVGKYLHGRA